MVVPADVTYLARKVKQAETAAAIIAALTHQRRRTVVQAGGCIGLWPLALSQHFARVYTFEVNYENFAALCENTHEVANISAHWAALGDCRRYVGLSRPRAQAGLWHVDGDGDIPMVPLDGLPLDGPIDALVLDVEGSELAALNGAEKVVSTYRPLLWFEYLQHTADLNSWLAAHGYCPPKIGGVGHDRYSFFAGD